MKITGSSSYVKFDFENGYSIMAQGEKLREQEFLVYLKTMKTWESPHENEELTTANIQEIIQSVNAQTNENTLNIIFE